MTNDIEHLCALTGSSGLIGYLFFPLEKVFFFPPNFKIILGLEEGRKTSTTRPLTLTRFPKR